MTRMPGNECEADACPARVTNPDRDLCLNCYKRRNVDTGHNYEDGPEIPEDIRRRHEDEAAGTEDSRDD